MEFKFDFDPDRLAKLKALRENGYEPYGGKYEPTKHSIEIRSDFDKLNGSEVKVAGRIMAKRDHGKLKFLDLADETGNIQIYITENGLEGRSKSLLTYLDAGDIVGVFGMIIKTKSGEVSVQAKEITLLAKSLLPLPPKWYGLEDTEKRYRKRYLDFIINTDSREKIKKGSIMLSAIRDMLQKKGFLEVTVPILHAIPGGTNAKPFITRYNALDQDFYLKIASELYLKRMLVGGFERVFDISKDLRNEGVDTRHSPEFTMLELYQAYGDLSDMLVITEEMIKTAIYAANKTYIVDYNGNKLDFSKFAIKTMEESVKEELKEVDQKSLIERAKKIDKKVEAYGEAINALFEEYVQKKLVQPTFITKYPIEVSPLAKNMKEDKRFVYRFELYVAGMEIANAFSELNDPVEQINRFNQEAQRKERGIEETQEFDRDFVEALGYGMPPAGGVGIGIERLQMIGTNSSSMKEVIAFPTLKSVEDEEKTQNESEQL
jgi:lysyl-tRNA synthetase class 2